MGKQETVSAKYRCYPVSGKKPIGINKIPKYLYLNKKFKSPKQN